MVGMKSIKLAETADVTALVRTAAEVLREGGLVCLPSGGRYRILARLDDVDAVRRLMQAKSRVKTAPALVCVRGEADIDLVAEDVHPLARRIARELWPQPVTIRVKPRSDLPSKVIKQLGGKNARVGVRMSGTPLMSAIVEAVGGPLLVSSANRERRAGDSSPAQVSKTFGQHIDLFLNDGDLQPGAVSTVIDFTDDALVIERQGAVAKDTIAQCAAR